MLRSQKLHFIDSVHSRWTLFGCLLVLGISLPSTASIAGEGQVLRPQAITIPRTDLSSRDPSTDNPLSQRLAPPTTRLSESSPPAAKSQSFMGGPLATILGALAVTLGVFAVFVLISRRSGGNALLRNLPREGVEVIGQTNIGPRQKLLVVRCGVQALVIGISPAGIQTVAQFDDPDEAGQFIAQCRGIGSAVSFKTTLRELEREPSAPGFIDNNDSSTQRSKLFLRA